MIRCPDSGALRAALDGERPDVAAHVTECASCLTRSAARADDAAFAEAGFTAQPRVTEAQISAALARAQTRSATQPAVVVPLRRRYTDGLLRVAAGLVAIVLVSAVLATPGGRAAAAALLERFRAERIAAVPVDFAAVDPSALAALVDHAEVDGLDQIIDPEPVADLDAAAAVAGFIATPLNRELLPAAVTGPMRVLAQAPQTVRITFSDTSDVPADLRGVTLALHVPGAVVQAVGVPREGPFALRGEAGSLEVDVEGGRSLEEVRSSLLALPGLPEETVESLRAIEDWETTLPLPVPAGRVSWSETTVGGQPALSFGDESGVGSVLLWHDGRRFVGVGGTMPLSQARDLAEDGG